MATYRDPRLRRTVAGIEFSNPLGLAAGFDKNALALPAFSALGFGFVEVGTVTREAQAGNARPRTVRFSGSRSLVNRLGFPNDGAERVAQRLAAYRGRCVPVGVSIGKSRHVPLRETVEDYCATFRAVAPYASYVAVNISSPNTSGLRGLHDPVLLSELLSALKEESEAMGKRQSNDATPIFLKIAPDLSLRALDAVLRACLSCRISGVIAANTLPVAGGGLSGPSLLPRTLDCVRMVVDAGKGRLAVVATGGISSADDIFAALCAGASLVQMYTAFVYDGPLFPKRVLRELCALLDREGIPEIGAIANRRTPRPA